MAVTGLSRYFMPAAAAAAVAFIHWTSVLQAAFCVHRWASLSKLPNKTAI